MVWLAELNTSNQSAKTINWGEGRLILSSPLCGPGAPGSLPRREEIRGGDGPAQRRRCGSASEAQLAFALATMRRGQLAWTVNRKHIAAWTLYDLAGSIYSAVIVAAVFNVYFADVIVGNEDGRGDQMWGWVGSLSVAIVAFSSPLLGSIADRAGVRKRLMILYTLLGVGAVASFTMLKPGMVWIGFALAVLANLGFEGGLVFYNAYLPEIAPKSHQGRVSGWGFGLGYAGSAVGLLAAYPLVIAQRLDLLWLFVAGWWLVFSLPAFMVLPEARGSGDSVRQAAIRGSRTSVASSARCWPSASCAAFCWRSFSTSMACSRLSGSPRSSPWRRCQFEQSEAIILFLVVQISALLGSLAMARPTDVLGPKKVINAMLVLWISVAVSAYFITSKPVFFAVAGGRRHRTRLHSGGQPEFHVHAHPRGKGGRDVRLLCLLRKVVVDSGSARFRHDLSGDRGNQRLAVVAIAGFFIVGGLLLRRVADPLADVTGRGGGRAAV